MWAEGFVRRGARVGDASRRVGEAGAWRIVDDRSEVEKIFPLIFGVAVIGPMIELAVSRGIGI